ncbi:hypothetical protein KY347_02850, partial [Candidatus Woesearchaeota archaeon]|nr:hypothetical protein [Candidatus Woesearchaeota archaeon]
MKPAFKFNIDYDFNAAEDICILSYDCGATCGDAENFDPMYKVRTYTCGEYFYNSKKDDYSNCREGLDDFNKQFECGEPPYSCYGDCPLCTCKRWRDSGCCEPGEKRQVRSCKHYTCPDDTERCVGVSCDEPCGEGCEDDSE